MIQEIMLTCPSNLCNKKLKYVDMMDHIKRECEFVILSCPGSCGIKGNRKALYEHSANCKLISHFVKNMTLEGNGAPMTFPPSAYYSLALNLEKRAKCL
jgi:hypothetical protein